MDHMEILDLAFHILYCPVCGSSFDRSKIYVAGEVDDKYVVQTVCKANHAPVQATLLVAFEQKGGQLPLVSYDDALDIKNALAEYNGTFKQLVS